MAKKARTAAQKRADAAASRRMKGKRPSFGKRRRSRKAARASKPKRRRTRMAKRRRSGRSRKGITANKMIVAAPAILGLIGSAKGIKESVDASGGNLIDAFTGVRIFPDGKFTFNPGVLIRNYAPVVGGAIGSKIVAKLVQKEPAALKQLANARLM